MRAFQRFAVLLFVIRTISAKAADWHEVGGDFKGVSIGKVGVWGVNKHDNIYYRVGTYEEPKQNGSAWLLVSGQLKQLDAGDDVVWGVTYSNASYVRLGINFCRPEGTTWKGVSGKWQHVSVSPNGHVWAVSTSNDVYIRTGITVCKREGTDWKQLSGSLDQVDAGMSGVWGVYQGKVFYRNGTYGDKDAEGSGWIQVDGSMEHVSSGKSIVVGVNAKNEVYKRRGVSSKRPTGASWTKIPGEFKMADAYARLRIWGVDVDDKVYYFSK